MIRKQKYQQIINMENPQKGSGILTMKKILNGPDELDEKGRAFNHCFLSPGSGLGLHRHEGTTETLYILHGQGEYTDENGDTIILNPGDVTFTDNGESHSIFCLGDEPLEFVALVLFKESA